MANFLSKSKLGITTLLISSAMITQGFVVTANAGSDMSEPLTNSASDIPGNSINTSYHYKRGLSHFQDKDYEKAYKSFSMVLRGRPHDANTNFYMARIHASRGNHSQAIINYNNSLKHYTNQPILLAGLGTSYAKNNNLDQAKTVLRKLEMVSQACDNTCKNAPMIATSLHVVAMSMYPAIDE